MALFAEGSTDHRFLNSVAQRTASRILQLNSMSVVDVPELQIINPRSNMTQEDQIFNAALAAHGHHLLLVHADADARSREAAWSERIEPGMVRALEASNEGAKVCDKIVPVIPVRMTESWMLADPAMLISVIGTRISLNDLSLPTSPSQVERITHPKDKLGEVVKIALKGRSRRRRRERNIGRLYEPLARRIDLDRLERVPAFRKFRTDLTQVLRELHFI